MSLFAIEIVVELLVIATIVAVLAKSFRIPYTVCLVVVGLIISLLKNLDLEFLQLLHEAELSKDLILLIFLPPLLFEGTINMDLEILRRNTAPVVLFATVGTILSTAILGLSFYAAFGFAAAGALLLGAILAPTDPVSVIALFKEEGVDKNLSTIVEGESVFNDGIGVVFFLIFLEAVESKHAVTLGAALYELVREIAIGGGVGILIGYGAHRILGRIDDRFTEVMISVALAYGVYIVAEHLHASGVIAVVAAGLIIGNYGKILSMSPTTRLALTNFWEVAAFMVNSILFLLMGMGSEMERIFHFWQYILVAYLAVVLGRSAIVYGLTSLLNLYRRPISRAWQHIMNWGGLRGSIPVALALGLPAGIAIETAGQTFHRSDITQIIFGVVLLSLLLQGLSIGWLLRRLGFGKVPHHEREYDLLRGRTISLKAAREALARLNDRGEVSENVYQGIVNEIDRELADLSASRNKLVAAHYELNDTEFKKVSNSLLLSERAALEDAFRKGLLAEEAMDLLTADIDTKIAHEGVPFYSPEERDDVPDLPVE